MAIFNSYVCLPEGIYPPSLGKLKCDLAGIMMNHALDSRNLPQMAELFSGDFCKMSPESLTYCGCEMHQKDG